MRGNVPVSLRNLRAKQGPLPSPLQTTGAHAAMSEAKGGSWSTNRAGPAASAHVSASQTGVSQYLPVVEETPFSHCGLPSAMILPSLILVPTTNNIKQKILEKSSL